MKVKKLIGKTINGFTILDTYPVTTKAGNKTRKVKLQCVECGRIFERTSSVDFDHIKCKCKCKSGKTIGKYHSIEWNGKRYTKAEFCRANNLNYEMFCKRIKNGMPIEKAMTESICSKVLRGQKFHFIDWQGKRYTQTDFCKMHDISPTTFRNRIKRGMSIEDAIKKEFENTCEICGKTFTHVLPNKKFCSKTCMNRKHDGKGPYKKAPKTCVVCGKVFMGVRRNAKTCSEKCRWDFARIDRNRRYKHLKEIGEFDESATLPNVFNRFKGICQSCGDQLTFDEDWLSGKYPSIDHVIPLSKGGTHTWDNIQLLCRSCNCKKSNKMEIFA